MSEKIEIDANELRTLIDNVHTLTAQVRDLTEKNAAQEVKEGRVVTKRVSQRNVTIMFLNGKPVVGMENVGSESNPVRLFEMPDPKDNKKYIMCANLLIMDPKTKQVETFKNVNWLEFIQQGERRECTVNRIVGQQWVVDQGVTAKQELQGDRYHMKDMGIDVPVEVSGVDNYYHVDIDGEEVEVFQDYVNMAKSTPRGEKEIIKEVTSN